MRSIFDIILFSDKVNYDGSFGLSAEIFYRLWLGQNCGSRSEKFQEKKKTKLKNFQKQYRKFFEKAKNFRKNSNEPRKTAERPPNDP